MTTHKLAIIGYGAIAQQLIQQLQDAKQAYQCAVLLRADSAKRAQIPNTVQLLSSTAELIAWQADLIVEAAGQQAVAEYLPACLAVGHTVLITSIGALAQAETHQQLLHSARQGGGRIRLLSGAIGALDYLRAASRLSGTQVHYESRKPLSAWQNELRALDYDPAEVRQAVSLFKGSADQAAQRYPQNLNVAAALALAGVGMKDTQVQVIADPAAQQNQHILHISGPAGELRAHISNAPSPDNPKTSLLVAYSLLDAVERHFEVIGFA